MKISIGFPCLRGQKRRTVLIAFISVLAIFAVYLAYITHHDNLSGERIYNGFNRQLSIQPSGDEAFFIETSRASTLSYRQACSVESLALKNPSLKIRLLMSTGNINRSSETVKVLENYSNIAIQMFEPAEVFFGSPLEHWFFRTNWFTGKFRVPHLADALRFLILYKYGGYYFDMDVIVMQPLTSLRNFSAAEADDTVSIGAMHFDYMHPAVVDLVEEFRTSYNKDLWAHAGPGAITRVLNRYCKVQRIEDALFTGPSPCKGFTIYTQESFYPIHWSNWPDYFRNGSDTKTVLNEWMQKPNVLGAHVWNSLSTGEPVFKGAGQLYGELARLYCPRVYSVAPEKF